MREERLNYVLQTAKAMSDRLTRDDEWQTGIEVAHLKQDVAWLCRAVATLAALDKPFPLKDGPNVP